MKRQLAKNTVINYAKTGLIYALGIALVPIMLDALGPTAFGIMVLVGSLTDASNVLQSGLGLSIAKYTAACQARDDVRELNRIVSSAMLVSLATVLLFVLGYAAFFIFLLTALFRIPPDQAGLAVTYALLTLPMFLAAAVMALYGRLLEGIQRYDILAAFDISGSVIGFVVTVWVLKVGYGLIGLAVSSAVMSFMSLSVMIVVARRVLPNVRLSFRAADMAGIKETASFSWSAIVTKSLAYVGDRTNPWIIGLFMPVSAIATYSVASKFHGAAKTLSGMASSAMMPVASALDAQAQKERLLSLHLRATKYAAAVSLPVILSGIVLAAPLIHAWVGPKYLSAAPLAQVFLAYLIFALQTNTSMSIMLGMGEHRRVLTPMIVATVVNVALSVFLTQSYGAIGVIIGTAVSGLIIWASAQTIMMRLLGESLGRYVRESLLGPYGVAIPVYAGLWAVTAWLPPANIFAVLAYALVAWVIYMALFVYNGLSPAERVDLRKGLRAVGIPVGRLPE